MSPVHIVYLAKLLSFDKTVEFCHVGQCELKWRQSAGILNNLISLQLGLSIICQQPS